MVTVEADAAGVERRLVEGQIRCPGCGEQLARWGHARARMVRGMDQVMRLVPRRARCRGCRVTHVLLPVFVLLRRADMVEVIGAAFEARAGGAGARAIAAMLGRASETVRGWLRRLGPRLETVRGWLTAVAVSVSVDPGGVQVPAPAGSGWADLLAAAGAVASAIAARFAGASARVVAGDPGWVWRTVAAVSSGRLLAPSWPSS